MWEHVGIIRTKKGLQTALKLLNKLSLKTHNNVETHCNASLAEYNNMLAAALLITSSALKRQKSLGGHYLTK